MNKQGMNERKYNGRLTRKVDTTYDDRTIILDVSFNCVDGRYDEEGYRIDKIHGILDAEPFWTETTTEDIFQVIFQDVSYRDFESGQVFIPTKTITMIDDIVYLVTAFIKCYHKDYKFDMSKGYEYTEVTIWEQTKVNPVDYEECSDKYMVDVITKRVLDDYYKYELIYKALNILG